MQQFVSKEGTFVFFDVKSFHDVVLQRLLQETQLSLTNRATRLEVIKVTKHGTISYNKYGFLFVSYSNFVRKTHEIFDFKNAVTLKTGLRVHVGH